MPILRPLTVLCEVEVFCSVLVVDSGKCILQRIEDISWGEEKQQSDTKLRSSTPIRK